MNWTMTRERKATGDPAAVENNNICWNEKSRDVACLGESKRGVSKMVPDRIRRCVEKNGG